MRHHGAGLRSLLHDDAKATAIDEDYTTAELTERERAMLDYSVKLTRTPQQMSANDIQRLRAAGIADDEILDVCQVASYYNFVNRMADGLGVELEDYWAAGQG